MKDVDYEKLSEQYASFLVAIGGISITVLTLVLSVGAGLRDGESAPYLVVALVVATVSCFVGAHMMAETAAFISYSKESLKTAELWKIRPLQPASLGKRLFVIASISIFIAVALVSLALTLLSTAADFTNSPSFKWIFRLIFGILMIGLSCWVILGILYRMREEDTLHVTRIKKTWGDFALAIVVILIVVTLLGFVGLRVVQIHWKGWLLGCTFIPIIVITGGNLVYFALSLRDSQNAPYRKLSFGDVGFFSSAIALSYACVLFAGLREVFWP